MPTSAADVSDLPPVCEIIGSDYRVDVKKWPSLSLLVRRFGFVGPVLEVGRGALVFQHFGGGFAGQDECLNSVRLPHFNGMPIIWGKARIVMG